MGTLYEDRYIFLPRSVLLRIRNISNKSCGESQNIHFIKFCSKNCAFYDVA